MPIKRNLVIGDSDRTIRTYFNEISSKKPLTRKEELTLWKRYKENDDLDARNKLVEANLKFVATIANNYRGRGLSYEELIEEGNVGLIRAMEKFEGDKGYKVISYSVWWIRQAIQEALSKKNILSFEELPQDYEEQYEDALPLQKVEEPIPSVEIETNEDNYDLKILISKLMDELDEREKEIVSRYYGLYGDGIETLEGIGKDLSITKERVRQLLEKAKKKLRTAVMLNSSFATIYK